MERSSSDELVKIISDKNDTVDFLRDQVSDLAKALNAIKGGADACDLFGALAKEERFIADSIMAARKIQTMLWGEVNGSWGLEEWRRMFVKRFVKIEMIDPSNPHAIVELKKRLLQNAALSVALIGILHYGRPIDIENNRIPSNLPEYTDR